MPSQASPLPKLQHSEPALIPAETKSAVSAGPLIGALWQAKSLHGRMARGAVWSLVGTLSSQGSALATSIFLARLLGIEEFGEYAFLQNTAAMLGTFAGSSLGVSATKHVAELRDRDPQRAARAIFVIMIAALAFGAILAVVLFALAPVLARRTLHNAELTAVLQISGLLAMVNTLNGVQIGALAGLEAFPTIARINALRGFITLPVIGTCAYMWHLEGAMWALVAVAFTMCLASHERLVKLCNKSGIEFTYSCEWHDSRIMWTFSLPAFLGSAMTSPAVWLVNSILVSQPNGKAQLGLFSAANQWRAAVSFLPSLLSQPLLALLANIGGKKDKHFRNLLKTNLVGTAALSAGVGLCVIFLAPYLLDAYGPQFKEARVTLIVLVLATIISSVAAVVGQALASLNKMWGGFFLNGIWGMTLVGVSLLLVPRYGGVGLALAFLISYLVHGVTVTAYLRLHLLRPTPKTTCPPGENKNQKRTDDTNT